MARNFWKEKAKYENFYASDVKLYLFAQSGLKLLKSLKDLSVCFTALPFFLLTDSDDFLLPLCFVDINSW